VLGPIRRPEAAIAGRYRGDELVQVGRTVPLSAQQSADRGAVLEPAEDDHSWPEEIGVGRWSKASATVPLTKVAPTIVVEVAADAALQAGQWRHGLRQYAGAQTSPLPTSTRPTESTVDNRRRRRRGSARLLRALAPNHGHPPAQPPAPAQARPVGRTALVGRQNGASALGEPGDTARRSVTARHDHADSSWIFSWLRRGALDGRPRPNVGVVVADAADALGDVAHGNESVNGSVNAEEPKDEEMTQETAVTSAV
jgi:hypothetical protein